MLNDDQPPPPSDSEAYHEAEEKWAVFETYKRLSTCLSSESSMLVWDFCDFYYNTFKQSPSHTHLSPDECIHNRLNINPCTRIAGTRGQPEVRYPNVTILRNYFESRSIECPDLSNYVPPKGNIKGHHLAFLAGMAMYSKRSCKNGPFAEHYRLGVRFISEVTISTLKKAEVSEDNEEPVNQMRHLCGCRNCTEILHLMPGTKRQNDMDKSYHQVIKNECSTKEEYEKLVGLFKHDAF